MEMINPKGRRIFLQRPPRTKNVAVNRPTLKMNKVRGSSQRLSENRVRCRWLPGALKDASGSVEIYELLGEQPFFRGLSLAELRLLAKLAVGTRSQPGQYIFRDGVPALRYCQILQGKVDLELELEKGQTLRIRTINPMYDLGLSWVIEPCYAHVRAKAVTATRAVFFHEATLCQQFGVSHFLAREIKRRIEEAAVESLKVTQQCLLQSAADYDA